MVVSGTVNGELYGLLEGEGIGYAIRLPANRVLQERIGHLLTRPVGRPPNKPQVFFASFSYQAQSWARPRRVVAPPRARARVRFADRIDRLLTVDGRVASGRALSARRLHRHQPDAAGRADQSTQVASALAADRGGKNTIGLFRAKLVDIPLSVGDDTATDSMWNLNPTIVNASFTTTWSDGLRIDEEVYARKSFVFTGAGNNGDAGYAQCWAYNALCVGGYNVNGTVADYEDDSLWSGTTYGNPDDGREVPQIVGPAFASKLARYQGSDYEPGVGTSFATPAVAGLAGLLVATHPSVVGQRPALMRAVLMASAQAHPISDPNGGKRVPDFNDSYDDRVGVGAPNGDRADAILKNRQYFYDARFEPADLGSHGTISAAPNHRVRVVMAWDQCPGYSFLSQELNVDFDMVVERETPHGVPPDLHFNLSDADNWEVVEFFTPIGGRYAVKVSAPRWSPCDAEGGARRARLALAWATEKVPVVLQ